MGCLATCTRNRSSHEPYVGRLRPTDTILHTPKHLSSPFGKIHAMSFEQQTDGPMEDASTYLEHLRGLNPKTRFGRWLQEQMVERKLTMGALSEYTGVHKTMISEYLRKTKQPTPRTARKLAEYFDANVDEVLKMLPGIAEEAAPAMQTPTAYPTRPEDLPEELRPIFQAIERTPGTPTGRQWLREAAWLDYLRYLQEKGAIPKKEE